MARACLNSDIRFATYWSTVIAEPGKQFEFFEEHLPDQMERSLRAHYFAEAMLSRNRDILQQCRSQLGRLRGRRVSLSRIVCDCFGGDASNIQRNLKNGKATDEVLARLMIAAGVPSTDWRITPHHYHFIDGLAQTVEFFRILCRTDRNSDLEVPGERSDVELSTPHAALLYCLFRDDAALNKWLCLSVPFARCIHQLTEKDPLSELLRCLGEDALALFAPHDSDSRRTLNSWMPDRAAPVRLLEEVAKAWNPFQLYWYLVHDAVKH